MGEPAKKLPPTPDMPALEPGDTLVSGLIFPSMTRVGTALMVGAARNFDFDVSGLVERMAVKKNGNVSVIVRTGGNFANDGTLLGYRYREIIFFQNGMYAAVPVAP